MKLVWCSFCVTHFCQTLLKLQSQVFLFLELDLEALLYFSPQL